jgi:hypothetical protein
MTESATVRRLSFNENIVLLLATYTICTHILLLKVATRGRVVNR